jgi:integrase
VDRRAVSLTVQAAIFSIALPTKPELQAIIAGAAARKNGIWRAVVLVAIVCGLRASELRGLRWVDVDLDARRINVNQRAARRVFRLLSPFGCGTLQPA